MAKLSPLPVWQICDNTGTPIVGALLYTYEAGTSNLKTTYTDATGDTPASNPIVTNSAGRLSVWLDSGAYKFILTDGVGTLDQQTGRTGTTIWTVDNITANNDLISTVQTIADLQALDTPTEDVLVYVQGYYTAGDGGGGPFYWDSSSSDSDDGGVTIEPDSSPATGRWKRIVGKEINVRWFGAKGDGATNDGPEFAAADDFCQTDDYTLVADAGTYIFSSDPTIVTTLKLLPNAILKWDSFNPTLPLVIDVNDNTQHFDSTDYPVLPAGMTIKPQWWGATGDGATDDTAAFTYASAAIPNGGALYIPATDDSYYLNPTETYTITLKSNCKIYGDGEKSKITIKNSSFDTGHAVIGHDTTSQIEDVAISGIYIDGNLANNTCGTGIAINVKRGVIENCKIENCFDWSINAKLENSTIQNNTITDNAIYVQDASESSIVKNHITATSNGVHSAYGIYVAPSSGSEISNLNIENNTLIGCPIYGVAVPTNQTISAITINENLVDLSRTDLGAYGSPSCITLYEVVGVAQIARNTLYPSAGTTSSGIMYGAVTTPRSAQHEISGNIIRVADADIGTTHNGITVKNSSGSVIKDNNIRCASTSTDYGIAESGTCTNIIKAGNVIINLTDYTQFDQTSITEGTFDLTFGGFTVNQQVTCYWKKTTPINAAYPSTVELHIGAFSGTSNDTSCTTGIGISESTILPNTDNYYYANGDILNNGSPHAGGVFINTSGTVSLALLSNSDLNTGVFTGSGTKGTEGLLVIYSIWP